MSDTRTTPYQTRTHTAPRKRRQGHRTTRHAVRRTLHCQGELPGGIYRMRENGGRQPVGFLCEAREENAR